MALQSSGTISMSQIHNEFGAGHALSAYRNRQWYTPQGGAGTFSASNLGLSDFYNKTTLPPFSSLNLSDISIAAARNYTYDQAIAKHTFTAYTLGASHLQIGSVTVSDICGRDYAFAVILGGQYIYKLTKGSSPLPDALTNETTTTTICGEWNLATLLTNKIISLPAGNRYVGSVLEFRLYLEGGSDCCKGMNLRTMRIYV